MNQKVTGTASSMSGGLAAGALSSIVITIVGALIAAHFVSKEIISQDNIGYCSMTLLLIASLVGAKTSGTRIKRRCLIVSCISGTIYYALLLGATALFFGGIYDGMGVTALVVLCGSMLAAMTGPKGEGSSRRRRKQIRHR